MYEYKYVDKLNDWEIELLELVSNKLTQYGISKINVDRLKFAFCTSQRCHQIGIKDTKFYAVIGDKILDVVIYKNIYTRDGIREKGDLDNLRQAYSNNTRLYNIMERSELSPYVLLGHGESCSETIFATAFETLIFIIDLYDGVDGVNNFLNNIKFYDLSLS